MKTLARLVVLSLTVVVVLACAPRNKDEAQLAEGGAQLTPDDTIREAVFRYQFEHSRLIQDSRPKPKVYFLSCNNINPSPALMSRFAGQQPRVKPVSAATVSLSSGTTETQTGKRGLVLNVDRVRLLTPSKAEVEGGDYKNGLAATGNTYTLELRDGKWVVVKETMNWIS